MWGLSSICSDLRPWDTAMCVGKSQLLQQSSGLQSSEGIVRGNNWEWVESQTLQTLSHTLLQQVLLQGMQQIVKFEGYVH